MIAKATNKKKHPGLEKQKEMMHQSGFMPATDAADVLAMSLSSIHRMLHDGALEGRRLGKNWYVNARSIIDKYADLPPIVARVRALGFNLTLPAPDAKPAPKETPDAAAHERRK